MLRCSSVEWDSLGGKEKKKCNCVVLLLLFHVALCFANTHYSVKAQLHRILFFFTPVFFSLALYIIFMYVNWEIVLYAKNRTVDGLDCQL